MPDCLFCNIALGFEPSSVVLEDERHLAFHDLFPKAEHHVLVIPRAHAGNLDDFVAGGGDAAALMRFTGQVVRELGVGGAYRLITNVGRDAGQMIPHLHWHLLAGDGIAEM